MGRKKIAVLAVVAGLFLFSSSTVQAASCLADTNCDQKVNLTDLVTLKGEFLNPDCGPCEYCPYGMVDCGDKCVDPDTDREHCGVNEACLGGTICGTGAICIGGSCQSLTSYYLNGFGTISGVPDIINSNEITSNESFYFNASIDFGTVLFDVSLLGLLSTGAQEVYYDNNNNMSEAFAYDFLYRAELAQLLKTESEIVYIDPGGKRTDLLVEIDGHKIGVSVTRALSYPPGSPFTVEAATALLEARLNDIIYSTNNVAAEDAWYKQILFVFAYSAEHADSLMAAHGNISQVTLGNTIIIVVITDGADSFLY